MKKIVIFIFILVLGSNLCAQTDSSNIRNQKIVKETNNSAALLAYNQGDYYKAIDLFQKEVVDKSALDLESPTLYYNLGNAYYRVNNLGKARLYYEKALLLKPNFENAKFNIGFIENKIQKSVSVDGDFFFRTLLKKLSYTESSNTWNVIAIVAFIILLINLTIFFFTNKELIKKIVFYLAIVFVAICVICNIFAFDLAQDIKLRNQAIITSAEAIVYTAPDTSASQVTTLQEAFKVTINKDDNNWLEIKLYDGTTGWIQSSSLEII